MAIEEDDVREATALDLPRWWVSDFRAGVSGVRMHGELQYETVGLTLEVTDMGKHILREESSAELELFHFDPRRAIELGRGLIEAAHDALSKQVESDQREPSSGG